MYSGLLRSLLWPGRLPFHMSSYAMLLFEHSWLQSRGSRSESSIYGSWWWWLCGSERPLTHRVWKRWAVREFAGGGQPMGNFIIEILRLRICMCIFSSSASWESGAVAGGSRVSFFFFFSALSRTVKVHSIHRSLAISGEIMHCIIGLRWCRVRIDGSRVERAWSIISQEREPCTGIILSRSNEQCQSWGNKRPRMIWEIRPGGHVYVRHRVEPSKHEG